MKHTRTKNERESDSKGSFSTYSLSKQGNVMKRLLVLMMISLYLVFAGAQSAPTTKASGGCDLVCGEPFIDPKDGRCYQMCCPADEQCKMRCELRPCDK
jgi:hypothetical protein